MSDVPLHMLTGNETKMWLGAGALRKAIAEKIRFNYPSGAAVLSISGHLIAYVQPNGAVRELPPPHRRFEKWQIANKPKPNECACREFYDPEIGGPWRLRGTDDHHPVCEFDQHAVRVLTRNNELHAQGEQRPDLLLRLREVERGERGNKTGPRTG